MMSPDKQIAAILISCALVLPAIAADAEPFAELDKMTQPYAAWAGPKTPLAREFNAERDRRGDRFERCLLTFVGRDPTRHYWCGSFLTAECYLGGRVPKPLLAIALWEQALVLESAQQKEPHDQLRSLHHLLAVQYSQLGFHTRAAFHKRQAECLWTVFSVGGPATSSEEMDIYDAIELPRSDVGNQSPHFLVDPATGQLWSERNGKCEPAINKNAD